MLIRAILAVAIFALGIFLLKYGWDYMRPKESTREELVQCGSFFFGLVAICASVAVIAWPA